MKKKIYLIGFMCSGKTSVAKMLKKKYGIEYVDTDEEIILKTGMNLNEYFKKYGEYKFRKLETEILYNVSKNHKYQVIACGGGLALKEKNVIIMRKHGIIIWLYCGINEILKRLTNNNNNNNNRPILKNKKDFKTIACLMKKREYYYKNACNIKINGKNISIESLCKEIFNII